MIARIGMNLCVLLFLALLLAGIWASREEASPRDNWTLDAPVQSITHFTPQEKLSCSFRLCNTAQVPLRILGASIC